MNFALSIAVAKSTNVEHVPILVQAQNKEEALEIGQRLANRLFPKEEGWKEHSVGSSGFVIENEDNFDQLISTLRKELLNSA